MPTFAHFYTFLPAIAHSYTRFNPYFFIPTVHIDQSIKKYKCEFCSYEVHAKRYLTEHVKKVARHFNPQFFQPQVSTLDFLIQGFSTMNSLTPDPYVC